MRREVITLNKEVFNWKPTGRKKKGKPKQSCFNVTVTD
jgi:hypothetical protein